MVESRRLYRAAQLVKCAVQSASYRWKCRKKPGGVARADSSVTICAKFAASMRSALVAVLGPCCYPSGAPQLTYIAWKDRKAFVADLKAVYQAPTREVAKTKLLQLAEHWGDRYPVVNIHN